MFRINRRQLLSSSAALLLAGTHGAHAVVLRGGLPWTPGAATPPEAVTPGGWKYFTAQEAATVEAFVERLIPADELSPSGKECGCAVYIDRQLAGPAGRNGGFYMAGPFQKGTKQQGAQSADTLAQQYRKDLAAFDAACRAKYSGKPFAELTNEQKDETIKGLEDGSFKLDGTDPQDFFKLILKDTQTGFLADPIYGGNNDMASWKMIGFPGAHYDYRDWIDKHNQKVTLPTVGIANHPNWAQQ
ncbi:MAG TPA: gluconate 2-dehydrogenase subunit 3 family protein [Xanthobacteraceae bacterium]|nr:gluconate 2-dehydrogenase subunit 3 family protein [Xanthobacteraceae bacterium]